MKSLDVKKMKPFTKEDWPDYNGAEKFGNGDEPIIAYYGKDDDLVQVIIIADKNGIQVELTSPEADQLMMWQRSLQIDSANMAKAVLTEVFGDGWSFDKLKTRYEYTVTLMA